MVPVELDGKDLDALLDTGATNTILTEKAASQYFDLKRDSPGMTRVDDTYYQRTFDTLDLNGLAISHPVVLIRNDDMGYALKLRPQTGTRLSSAGESNGLTSIILGMHELKHFRVFISYKEQKLYLTPATPTGAVAKSPTGAASSPSSR